MIAQRATPTLLIRATLIVGPPVLGSLLAFHALVDPRQYQVRDLQVVLVLHEHVAVAKEARVRQVEHHRVTPYGVDCLRELLATAQERRPRGRVRDVVAEDDEDRNRRELGDFLGGGWFVKLRVQLPSIETRPLMPLGSISAASSGKKPDSECPIRTAPFKRLPNAARFAYVGLRAGSSAFRSGITCLPNSSAAFTGNCSSENAVPKLGPKRNRVQASSWLKVKMFGSALAGC